MTEQSGTNQKNEDMLTIHLLQERLDAIKSAVIGQMCGAGGVESPALRRPNIVEFRLVGEPAGVRRQWGFSRRPRVRKNRPAQAPRLRSEGPVRRQQEG